MKSQFARRIRADRLAAGWTQSKLAQESGLHYSTISKLESGERSASRSDTADTVIRLAQALRQPTRDYLILAGHIVPESEMTFAEQVAGRDDLTDVQKKTLVELYDRFTGNVR